MHMVFSCQSPCAGLLAVLLSLLENGGLKELLLEGVLFVVHCPRGDLFVTGGLTEEEKDEFERAVEAWNSFEHQGTRGLLLEVIFTTNHSAHAC